MNQHKKETVPNDGEVRCLYCPEMPLVCQSGLEENDEMKWMHPDYLTWHVAACHVDFRMERELPVYKCDGSCSTVPPFDSYAVNSYVEHMEKLHPAQPVDPHLRYKSALSNLMAELCVYETYIEKGAPDKEVAPLSQYLAATWDNLLLNKCNDVKEDPTAKKPVVSQRSKDEPIVKAHKN